MRRQEGSLGWRTVQDKEVINGCAGEVIGDIEDRLGGRVVESGKRIGGIKGLLSVKSCEKLVKTYYLRVI